MPCCVAVNDRNDHRRTVGRDRNGQQPAQRNALGDAGKLELAEAIERVSAATGLRVVILTGAGNQSFIGGANLKEMSTFVRHAASDNARFGLPEVLFGLPLRHGSLSAAATAEAKPASWCSPDGTSPAPEPWRAT